MKLDLDCKEVSRLISQRLEQELPPSEQARLRLHFVLCDTCRDVEEQMSFLRRAMRQLGKEDPDER
jgi:predicted anti-sigma-YlaC factor YlaD